MTDDQYKDMVIGHDKHLDALNTSIVSLADNVQDSNRKLDSVLEVVTQQNVLVERMNNLDRNAAESFGRAWTRLDKVEKSVESEGCALAKAHDVGKKAVEGRLKEASKDIKELEHEVKDIKNTYVSGTVIKWFLAALVTYSITFGTYTVQSQHELDTEVSSYMSANTEFRKTTNQRLDNIVEIVRQGQGPVLFQTIAPVGPVVK